MCMIFTPQQLDTCSKLHTTLALFPVLSLWVCHAQLNPLSTLDTFYMTTRFQVPTLWSANIKVVEAWRAWLVFIVGTRLPPRCEKKDYHLLPLLWEIRLTLLLNLQPNKAPHNVDNTSEQNQAKDISAVSPANKVKAPKGHPRNDLMSKTVVVRLQDTSSKISSIDEHVTWSINRRGNLGHSRYNTGNVLGASRRTPACLSHEEKQKCSQDCVWL